MPNGPEQVGLSTLARVLRAIGRALVIIPRPLAVVMTLAWAAVIWFFSAQRPAVFEIASAWGGVLSNLAHAPEFALFTAGLLLCLPRRDRWPDLSRANVIRVLAIVLAYASIDELHQAIVPLRDASVFDVMTDLAGAIILVRIAWMLGPGERLSPVPVLRTLAWGALACLASACLASFVPQFLPTLTWL
jgi:hypothetical protein